MEIQSVLIGVGGNLPIDGLAPAAVVQAAAQALQVRLGTDVTLSRIFQTPAFPAGSGPDYANAALALTPPPGLTATGLLAVLHQIEAQYGRTRLHRWAGRTLDLDLLAMGNLVLPDEATQKLWRDLAPDQQAKSAPDRLILPHPRLQDRAFVLVPLADIAPDWRHPLLGLTVLQMIAALPPQDVASVRAL